MPSERKAVLVIQYRGTLFFGSQIQVDKPTIAGELTRALNYFTTTVPKLEFASRTDAGVHALGQVVSFCLPNSFPPIAQLGRILNNYLPDDIRVIRCYTKPADFHARFSAIKRDYCYSIYHGSVPKLEYAWKSWHLPLKLNWDQCQPVITEFIQRENWQNFCTQPADCFGFLAKLDRIDLKQSKSWSKIYFSGKRFLYKMLVNITGLLVALASNKISLEQALSIARGEANYQLTPAPAKGLCLLKVHYK